MNKLFDTTAFRVSEQGLKIMSKQAEVIAQNISNQDTPGYNAKYLYFEGVLKDAQANTAAKFKKELNIETAVYTDFITNDQPDGNNVDNDTQQALFVKNRLMYDMLFNQLNSEFSLMRTALRKS
ncbi:MAG: flagellar basal body rod protein FlgB [Oscillospiraceae bacterium]|jgi:flagellar basal-body rod protein FlgB|nr:flagellar basal body rod protein FlgB [Oscillospiraceae bacterium]